MKHTEDTYCNIIIGGTTKAATTSLYHYLADHPDICASTLKETRFFLDLDYPVQPLIAKWQDGLQAYNSFFTSADQQFRVESTPDYLYSEGTAARIKALLPRAKIIFLLRDPLSRLISWYSFAKQRENIPQSMTFEKYIETQLRGQYFTQAKQEQAQGKHLDDNNYSYFLSALEQGRYTQYLKNYFDIFGSDCVKVYFYEDLCSNPQSILIDICNFIGLDSQFYCDYDFKVFNRSIKIENVKLNVLYSKIRQLIRRKTHNLPIHKFLKKLKYWFEPLYYRFNSKAIDKVEVNTTIQAKLKDYYLPDILALENLLGKPVPWKIKTTP